MLLKIIKTTDGQYEGKFVEYNEFIKFLTLPNGEHIYIEKEIIEDETYILKNSNYILILKNTING